MGHTWWGVLVTVGLLFVSNAFMTFAWYGHLKLKDMGVSANWPLYVVILFSWAIALFEYCFQVPA
ncbi:MAG: DMT family protein, partial [Muribaculaceae bacterium]|nr:DMT family protein [Muribaculaceae bacterium]